MRITRQSSVSGDAERDGQPTFPVADGSVASENFFILSASLPEYTPQLSAERTIAEVTRFIVNSPVSSIILYECRDGRSEI